MSETPALPSISAVSAPFPDNPFSMPPGSGRFRYRDELDQLRTDEWNAARQMTIVQRSAFDHSAIPPLVSRGTLASHAAKVKASSIVPPVPPKTTRRMGMREFVAQKREIFLIQLMIQRKCAEMSQLSQEIQSEEQNCIETERRISELSNQYKLESAKAEAALAQGRRATEVATKQRMDLQKLYHFTQQRTAHLRTDILRNRDLMEDYQGYQAFLRSVTPDGYEPLKFFVEPGDLIEEIEGLQEANRFLVSQCEAVELALEKATDPIVTEMKEADETIRSVSAKMSRSGQRTVVEEGLTEGDMKMAERLDGELGRLSKLIGRVHVSCFGSGGSLPPLLMLERIESGLDDLLNRFERVHPQFAASKQRKKDEERLEKYKLMVAEKKSAEQKLKFEAALERAQMPIKKRSGRPPIKRMLPIGLNRKDPEQWRADQMERERIERLLYGRDVD
jgi:hypothetical protein